MFYTTYQLQWKWGCTSKVIFLYTFQAFVSSIKDFVIHSRCLCRLWDQNICLFSSSIAMLFCSFPLNNTFLNTNIPVFTVIIQCNDIESFYRQRKLCLIAASALSYGTWRECGPVICIISARTRQSHCIRVLQRLCGGGVYSKAINTFKNSTVRVDASPVLIF